MTRATGMQAITALGRARGITSVCSAHPLVIEAALRQGLDDGRPVLIEATCNQVNHRGGYTGMTPADFRGFVLAIADRVGFDHDRILFGGDHLGPNPWKSLPAALAMDEAAAMVEAYVLAGFTKIHLDTSMGCRGEPVALGNGATAVRAARLASVAEQAAVRSGHPLPLYVIGTEVPVPGGAREEVAELEVTRPEAALETLRVHREAFAALGLEAAFGRVVAAVVQPGVEFGDANVVVYDRGKARALGAALDRADGLVFEAHSTDYQPAAALRQLVEDGFAILKVGPALTFALREALYGLDLIAEVLGRKAGGTGLRDAMEALMLADPRHWKDYCHGDAGQQRVQRHFGYSDRIRYYWSDPRAAAAVERLFAGLEGVEIPETLVSQFLAPLYPQVVAGTLPPRARALCIAAVRHALRPYSEATGGAARVADAAAASPH